jgi:hypothetical protein
MAPSAVTPAPQSMLESIFDNWPVQSQQGAGSKDKHPS